MKQILFALVAIVTLNSFSPFQTITGNGNIKKETRNTEEITAIHLSGNMNVELTYGNSKTITVEADENILPYIETKVENGVLTIKAKDKVNLKSKSKLIIHASAEMLKDLKVYGSGNIVGRGKFTNQGKTTLGVYGSGNINLGMDNFNETKINISGSGNVIVRGNSTNNIEANISGSGNIDCSDVKCNDVFAHVSGSGNIKVYVNKSIDAKVSGSGNIYYRGDAKSINMKSSGSGKIVKV